MSYRLCETKSCYKNFVIQKSHNIASVAFENTDMTQSLGDAPLKSRHGGTTNSRPQCLATKKTKPFDATVMSTQRAAQNSRVTSLDAVCIRVIPTITEIKKFVQDTAIRRQLEETGTGFRPTRYIGKPKRGLDRCGGKAKI